MPDLSRTSSDGGHVLISGTGRAGTTLLVQYFTVLGFDTGFTPESARTRVDDISHAGLERSIRDNPDLPYVAKSPGYGNKLDGLLSSGELRVRACIVPMRDLYSAAESRRDVVRRAQRLGQDTSQQRGGLVYGASEKPASQERRLAVRFYELVHALVRHDVRIYFLKFPDFANQPGSLFDALEPLLASHGVTRAESDHALASVVRPDLIHDFSDGQERRTPPVR